MVPKNLVPLDKWSPSNLVLVLPDSLSPWTNKIFRDHLSRGTKLVGDHLSMWTKIIGTICPWGLNWLGTHCLGPNVQWPYAFGTKCVTALYHSDQVFWILSTKNEALTCNGIGNRLEVHLKIFKQQYAYFRSECKDKIWYYYVLQN